VNPLKLTRFYTAKTLLDLTSVANAEGAYLLTVEHLRQASKPWRDTPTEKTSWRFWNCPEPGKPFRQSSESIVSLPAAMAISASLSRNNVLVFLESNQEHAAFLGTWKLADAKPLRVPDDTSITLPFDLDEERIGQVQIDMREEWSTAKLPPAQWLFNPSVVSLSNQAMVAVNTADAHAVVWQSSGTALPKRPLAFVPDALEPAVAAAGSKTLLFYRKPAPKWSVYFHAARYSGAHGPIALPLMLAELDPDGRVLHPLNLSEQGGLGQVFGFAVAGDAKQGFVLATIGGSREKPRLQMYVSNDFGKTLQMTSSADLTEVPYRLTTALNESTVVVGLVYKQSDGYQVDGSCMTLDK